MTEQGLIYRSGGRLQALALRHVVEIMRPLPIDETGEAPSLVKGLSVIRGEPTTVVDLAALSGSFGSSPRRLVSLRTAAGRFALLADDVLGVQPLPSDQKPMLQGLDAEGMAAVDGLAPDLRAVLQQVLILPDEPALP